MVWTGENFSEGIWKSEPPIGRVATGVAKRVDRLKCLGNAVVPQQVYPLLKMIATIELMGGNNTTG
jgi:DNA (cytosine-5)-methyltransferase 1